MAVGHSCTPRAANEAVNRVGSTTMLSAWGPLRMIAFSSGIGDILVAVSGIGDGYQVPVRVHDACLTGESFSSLKCDCGEQLRMALEAQTSRQHGATIYMPQEGRGIGLANKIAAYQLQEELGLDTVDANVRLGFPAEMRDYSALPHVLADVGIHSLMLMTNNPFKVEQLRAAGVAVEGTLPILATVRAQVTKQYMETKRIRMGHLLPAMGGAPPLQEDAARPVMSEMPPQSQLNGAAPPINRAAKPRPGPADLGAVNGAPWPPQKQLDLAGPAGALLAGLREEIGAHSGGLPFTLISFATSMDGFIGGTRAGPIGTQQRHPVALSGEEAAVFTHHLRGSVDAILIGIGTVSADDPRLDVRVAGAGPSPQPVVLDSHLRLPLTCRLLTKEAAGGRPPVLVLCTDEEMEPSDAPAGSGTGACTASKAARAAALEAAGAVVVRCHADRRRRVCLQDALRRLGEAGVRSVMVEGGAEVISEFLTGGAAGLAHRVVITQAGVILGSGVRWATPGGRPMADMTTFSLGRDAIFAARLSTIAEAP